MIGFSGNTQLETLSGLSRIDTIEIGDSIRCLRPDGTSVYEQVIYSDAAHSKEHDGYFVYSFSDGSILTVIGDLKVRRAKDKRLVRISKLALGETVVDSAGKEIELICKDFYQVRITYYTIFTEDLNSYVANGLVCGNIFSNIKWDWLRRRLIRLYSHFVSC